MASAEEIGRILQLTSEIEMLLENMGGTGRGLHDKATSIEERLPENILNKLRYIASVRNAAAHEGKFKGEFSSFKSSCEWVAKQLKNIDTRSSEDLFSMPHFEHVQTNSDSDKVDNNSDLIMYIAIAIGVLYLLSIVLSAVSSFMSFVSSFLSDHAVMMTVILLFVVLVWGWVWFSKRDERKKEKLRKEEERREEEEHRKEEKRKKEEEHKKEEKRKKEEDLRMRKEVIREEEQRNKELERVSQQKRLIPNIIQKRKEDDKSPDKFGDKGEALLEDAVRHHGNMDGCYWWLNKRVKTKIGDKGLNEIDLIVVSHNYIYVFESKYYGGVLIDNPNKKDKKNIWIKIKPKYIDNKCVYDSTEMTPEENLVLILQAKVKKLRSLLAIKGINLSPDQIKYKVVFTNKNFDIQAKKERDSLISINDIKSYLERDDVTMNESERLIISLIHYLVDSEPKSQDFRPEVPAAKINNDLLTANLQLLGAIDALPSWDSITFYGGMSIKGDILEIRDVFVNQADLGFLNRACDLVFRCKRNPSEIVFDWDNGKNQSIEIYDVEGNLTGLQEMNYQFPKIKFHQVGKERPSCFCVYEIEKIRLRGLYYPKREC